MTSQPLRWLRGAALATVLVSSASAAPPDIAAVQRLVEKGSPLCRETAAPACIDYWWGTLDGDGDGLLSAADLSAFRAGVETWLDESAEILTLKGRASLTAGLWLFERVGAEKIVAWYDKDGDERLSRAELLADVNIDDRPLPQILADPEGLDQAALRERFGLLTSTALRILRWIAVR